jgi:hypothetical protein
MSANEEPITERQLSYIKSLIEKRDVSRSLLSSSCSSVLRTI